MHTLLFSSCGEAHERTVEYVYKEGKKAITEDNEHIIELEIPLTIIIKNPLADPKTSFKLKVGPKFLEAYEKSLLTIRINQGNNTDPTYTYGNRLCDYPCQDEYGYTVGDGDNEGYNQIKAVIKKLQENANTRRAIAITWIPCKDNKSNEPPCLQLIWFKIDSFNKLNMVSIFRSNDVLSALGQNLYALSYLFKHVYSNVYIGPSSIESNYYDKIGTLTHIILSPHLYYVRDVAELKRFV